MSAAALVGRVGGLAVALGVGAIILGAGVSAPRIAVQDLHGEPVVE
jgi:hypothetical protein